jgi:hypothetical protein
MISFLHSHFPFAGLLKCVCAYLANTAVLCYSLIIICCCQVQNYIYWLISTENDHRHQHKFIKYEKRLRKEGNMIGLPINNNQALPWVRSIQRQRSNWSPYIYPAFVPFGRYFTSIPLYLWIRQSPLSSTRWHFLFCPITTCCLLFLNGAHAQDVFA